MEVNKQVIISYSISFLFVIAVALAGSLSTYKSTSSEWYRKCMKLSLTPPSWTFSVVWTILYILIAIAFAQELFSYNWITISLFAVNLILNVTWSLSFFVYKKITLALVNLIFIFITLVLIMVFTKNNLVRYLLIPYGLWLCFATALNALSIPKAKECSAIKDS